MVLIKIEEVLILKIKKEDIYYEHIINNGNKKYQNNNIIIKNDKNINAKKNNTRKSYQSVAIYNYKKKYNINKNNNDEHKINQVNIKEKDSNRN